MNADGALAAAALACVAAFGLVAPRLMRATRPACAVWLLSLGSVASATAGTVVLAMLSLPVFGRDDALMDLAGLSPRVLDKDTGSGLAIAAVCAVALTTLLGRFLRAVVGHRHAFRAASQAARACSAVRGQLLVLPQDAPDVYALGGRPAVIVATRGLLRSLPAIERRAVLVHEHAHIARRHHRHLAAATLSAALNPLLLRVPAASAFAVERWADELAASSTSRAATRSALTRLAGLVPAASKAPSPAALAAAATTSIAGRVAALRQAPPPLSPMRLIFPAGLAVGSILAAAVLTGHIVDLLAATAAATGKVLPHH